MSWTAPRTWLPGETLTAALLNTHIKDNMLMTEANLATGDGYFVGAAANSIVERKPKYAIVSGSTSNSTTTYNTLSVSVTTDTSDRALVLFSAMMSNNTANEEIYTSVAVSGATTLAASDDYAVAGDDATGGRERQYMKHHFFFALTPGSNTFTLQRRVSAGTGTWSNRRIFVLPF